MRGRRRFRRCGRNGNRRLGLSSQAIGDLNTLPLELQGLTTTVTDPAIYALGTITTAVSLLVIAIALVSVAWLRARRLGRGGPLA